MSFITTQSRVGGIDFTGENLSRLTVGAAMAEAIDGCLMPVATARTLPA